MQKYGSVKEIVLDKRGFSLVELMVVIVVAGLMMSSVYSLLFTQQKSYQVQEQTLEVQQGMRSGLDLLVYELRMAGYDPDNVAGAGITDAQGTTVTFTMLADDDGIDNDNADGDDDEATGADETDELKTITYGLYTDGGEQYLGRYEAADVTKRSAAIEHVEQLEFRYFDVDGNQTTTLDDIRSIRFRVLVRTARPDPNYTDSTADYYEDPDLDAADTIKWTVAAADANYRRRFQEMTVKCRNLGL